MALRFAIPKPSASAATMRTLCRFGRGSSPTGPSLVAAPPNVRNTSMKGPHRLFQRSTSSRGDQIRRRAGSKGETGLSPWLPDPLHDFGFHSPMLDLSNRMFEEMLSSPARVGGTVSPFSVPLDLVEKESEYVATAELPGMGAEDVSISVDNRVLTFKAAHEEKHDQKSEEDGRVVHSERRSRRFVRQFRLPKDVNEEGITASMDKGLLTLTLPRVHSEPPAGRSIPVQKAENKAQHVVPENTDNGDT